MINVTGKPSSIRCTFIFFETAASLENTWCTNIKRKHRNANIWPQTPINAHFRKLNIFLRAFWSGTHAKRRICCFFGAPIKPSLDFLSVQYIHSALVMPFACLHFFFFFERMVCILVCIQSWGFTECVNQMRYQNAQAQVVVHFLDALGFA